MRVAAVQMVSGKDLADNLDTASALIADAAGQGAKLVVLPENFALFTGGTAIAELAAAEAENGRLRATMAGWARRHRIIVVGGTIPLPSEDGRVYACSFVYSEEGKELGCYRKVHLFDAQVGDGQGRYCESDSYAPGNSVFTVPTSLGRLGVAVCYDMRFPEMIRLMLAEGMDILAVPAAFTRKTGWAHWLPLLRARAIENQVLVIGANQGGVHSPRRQTSGGSVIIDSWGTVLAEMPLGKGLVCAEANMAEQAALRQQMPVAEHRRF
ncbi:carbon-nitrogen hydrolase family protein [Spongiibacter nanhainus]|uniref:Carbon-nitrogen hydrolase family protein n=1 Tax=Spongiibacter nanhainus TaxID=2794344 RepID=A0A7T4R2I3_9GAMM|nr:carbon-nitrogen hydrolase family protein [Spongiibacter nanhainus]QQD19032.1 carbon-nitrogen hydrolase family protein [Spongiibacter nanhainus]